MKTEIIKTYKHKTSGWVATLTTTNCEYLIYRTDGSYAGSMAGILFENTNDWEIVEICKCVEDFILFDKWGEIYYLKIKGTENKYRCLGSNITKPYYFIDSIQYTIHEREINYRFVLVDINEKDYQILTVVDPNPKRGIISVTDGTFNYIEGDVINSIRRLSDNEIFSLGDAVQSIKSNWQGDDCKIEIIHAKDDGSIDFTINQNGTKEIYRNCLEKFRKAKKILFVTEDGVEIRIGDDYWVYDYGKLNNIHKVYRASQTHTGDGVNRKYFSTKEKAEEHILYNKPCLSLNDVLSTLRICISREDFEIAIGEICKSRIKI